MKEDEIVQNIAKANEAERLLNSPELKDAFARMKQSYIDGLTQTDFGDQRRIDRLHTMLVLLGELEAHLRATMSTGKVVAFEIEQEKKSFLGDILKKRSKG